MRIFQGRPLLVGGALFVLTAIAAWFYQSAALYICLIFAAVVLLFVFSFVYLRKKIGKYRFSSIICISVMCIILASRCCLFYLSYYSSVLELCGSAGNVCCTVKSRETSTGYSSSYTVEINEADGKTMKTKAKLDCGFASAYDEGDVLQISNAEITDAASVYLSYVSDGIYLICTPTDEDSITELGNNGSGIYGFFAGARNYLSYVLRSEIGGGSGKLCAAMLLGDKDKLPAGMELDFRRAGISHLLAVSGMHTSLMALLISKILGRLRLSRNISLICVSVFLLIYLFLLGFPFSAVRSVIMLAASYFGILTGMDSDGLSSLSFALWVLLVINPTAITDTGFILSFAASFGILALSPLYSGLADKYGRSIKRRPLYAGRKYTASKITDACVIFGIKNVFSPLMTVVSANVMTIVPVSLFYGEVSLFSPVSNLIFPVLALPLMTFSFFVLLFSSLGNMSSLFASLAGHLGDFMINLASEISDIRGVSLSLRHTYVLWILCPALAVTVILLAVKIKRRWTVLIPFGLAVCILLTVRAIPADEEMIFCAKGQNSNDVLYVAEGESAVIVEIGTGSYTLLRDTLDSAAERGATEAEVLVLTHTHTAHLVSVYRILGKIKTRQIWVPEAQTPEEAGRLLRLYEIAAEFGTDVCIYGSFGELTVFGNVKMRLSGSGTLSRSTQPLTSVEFDWDGGSIVYLGASSWEDENILKNVRISEDTVVVTGRHGPVLKNVCTFPLSDAAAVICREGCQYKYWFGLRENLPTKCRGIYVYNDEMIIKMHMS